ncbi:diguanylate cyclase [Candidatus Magnetobacterium bavaricum]|uniref:Diguanylate cyclase n=1 Tax=Candidatus Magnetobacterium bavaricum TaxID=29290 RepID=A0A0F3GT12_9BACT|nr:diguanylate cyclase [Candidatus Magnetobacterium bavaricum]
MVFKAIKEERLAIGGGVIVLSLLLVAILAPVLAPYQPDAIDAGYVLHPPDRQRWLGTDDLGRDILSRMIFGCRISLSVGFVAVGISTIIGIIVGSLAGFYGGYVDRVIMRFVDIMLSIPTFFLILAVIAFIDSSIWNIMLVIGLTSWMGVARLVRAEFLSLKGREFVLAAISAGASDARVIVRHMLPNALAPVIISAVLGIAGAVLVESSLSFLGLGVQPPTPSWGNILSIGKDNLEIAWWLSVFPGMAILITVVGYNLLGEGLRDALDIRQRTR